MKALQRYQMSKTEKAALKAEIARQVHELDEKFSAEICAMLLWALHEEFGFGADRLRRVWDCVAVHRAELLKHYDMQDNAEFILLYKLRQIGVDVEKWTAEPQTQVREKNQSIFKRRNGGTKVTTDELIERRMKL